MIARSNNVKPSFDRIVVLADMYYEKGEAGYKESWKDIPDRPAKYEGEEVPTHKEFFPFQSFVVELSLEATEKDIRVAMLKRLQAFKRGYDKVQTKEVQAFVGLEVKE